MFNILILISILTSFLTLSQAYGVSIGELVNSPTRPAMAEIKDSQSELRALPRDYVLGAKDSYLPNRGNAALHYNYDYWLKELINGGPHFLAHIEKAFPGAIWAFIGRDSMAIADLTEAFYLGIGQSNRVVRIGLSKQALAATTPEQMVKYLAQLGLDPSNNKDRPFILIDTVSSGYGRQGKILMKAVYDHVKKTGGQVHNLVPRFNMIGVIVSTFNAVPNPIESETTFKAAIEARKNQIQMGDTNFSNEPIFTYRSPNPLFSEAGYEHYTGVWHGPFGPLIEGSDGLISPNPGPVMEDKYRLAQIQYQNKIFGIATSDGFSMRVLEAARTLGYDFVDMQTKIEKMYSVNGVSELRKRMLKIELASRDIKYKTDDNTMKNKLDSEFAKFKDITKSNWLDVFGKTNESKLEVFYSKQVRGKGSTKADSVQYLFQILGKALDKSYLGLLDKSYIYVEIMNVLKETPLTEMIMNKLLQLIATDPEFRRLFDSTALQEHKEQIEIMTVPSVNSCLRFYRY